MTRLAALLLMGLSAPAALDAQPANGRDSSIAQISTASSIPPPASPANASAEAPDQLGSSNESTSATSQLSGKATSAAPAQQVSTAPRDARPPQPLSRPSDGRTAAVEAVRGEDRCDAARTDQNRTQCAEVIENRAAQFSRREAPVLSPEQKLLADQRTRESAADFEQAARRLAKSGETDNSLESLGIASVVLGSPAAPPKKREEPDDPAKSEATQAIINAIVSGSGTAPPQ